MTKYMEEITDSDIIRGSFLKSKQAPFTIWANRPTIQYGLKKMLFFWFSYHLPAWTQKKRDFIYELVTNAHLGDFIEDDLPTPRFGRNVKEILPATIV